MRGAAIVRQDGVRGTVIAHVADKTGPDKLEVAFDDGTRLVVSYEALIAQPDGTYRLGLAATDIVGMGDEMVIPVVAEELVVEKMRVERGRVRAHKRVETFEEVVDTPLIHEEVVVERVPVNQLVEGEVPQVREEDDLIVIPLVEEILVVETRLMVREEVRIHKRRTTTSTPQTVTLRREVVDIERADWPVDEIPLS
jgi:uncharacterized protein (TIGR02271 family)